MLKVQDIQYVVYGVSDLDRTTAFMADFGLLPLATQGGRRYFRGAGPQAYIYVADPAAPVGLQAVGMRLAQASDLEQATCIPGASPIENLAAPGGGRRVRVTMAGGLPLELVHGIEALAPLPMRDPLAINHGLQKHRVNRPQRPEARLDVLRLGHAALTVPDPVAARDWAQRHLGMIVSDALLVPGATDQYLGFFMRCDLGATPSDHHSVLIAAGERAGAHHISFEMQDIDAVHMAHEWMRSRGHAHHWGVGRHVLGSQVFDYWWDPDGMRIEHYADGDLYDNAVPATTVEATNDQLWTWGPPVPDTFFQQTRQG